MNIVRITSAAYDSRRGFNHEFSQWTIGNVYHIYLSNDTTVVLGWYNFDHNVVTRSCEDMLKTAYPPKDISLKEMKNICQEELATIMGDYFPWSDSCWGSREEYMEWSDPQTTKGIIIKSINDWRYFTKIWDSKKFQDIIEESYHLVSDLFANQGDYMIRIENQWFRVPYGLYRKRLYFASEEEVSTFIANCKAKEAERQAKAKAERDAKKDYARRCGELAKKYGIRFNVVLAIGDNATEVANFTNTLKSVCKCQCKLDNFTRADMETLGFHHCSSRAVYYVRECLEAGKILP